MVAEADSKNLNPNKVDLGARIFKMKKSGYEFIGFQVKKISEKSAKDLQVIIMVDMLPFVDSYFEKIL